MFETKYIPQENANKMVAILNKCLEINPDLKFHVITDDEGDMIYKGNNPEKAVNEMDGYDCNFGVNCMDNEKFIGWFFFTPYVDIEDVVCDHTDNDFCNRFVKNRRIK